MPNRGTKIKRCPDGKTYQQGCRCSFCRSQVAAAQARYRHRMDLKERGVKSPLDMFDAAEARELLKVAKKHKITDYELHETTGIQRCTLMRIRHGKTKRVRRETLELLQKALADPDLRAFRSKSLVPNKWAVQMVNSLRAQGWTPRHLQDILYNNKGINGGFIHSLLSGSHTHTRYENVEHVRWLVTNIGRRTGPSTRTAFTARKHGHFPTHHYNGKGDLLLYTLTPEQRKTIAGV